MQIGYTNKSNANRAGVKQYGKGQFTVEQRADTKWYLVENTPCAEAEVVVDVNIVTQTQDENEMPIIETTNNVEEEIEAAVPAELAAAQQNVNDAEDELEDIRATVKVRTEEVKKARDNVKQAKAFLSGLGEETEENAQQFVEGRYSLKSWEEALETATTARAAASEEVKVRREKLSAAKKELKAVQKAHKAPKARKERATGENRDTQNGILRPLDGSKSAIAWQLIEKVQAELNAVPTMEQIKTELDAYNATAEEALKASRVQSAFRKWRKYHGIAVGPAAPAAAPAAPAE